MQKHSQLYLISEPEAPAAANVVPNRASAAASPPRRRQRSWRNLTRRMQQTPAPHKPLA